MRTLTSACERPFSLPKHRTSPMLAAERPTIRWGMNSLPQRTLPRLCVVQALQALLPTMSTSDNEKHELAPPCTR